MKRREFLSSSLAVAGTAALAGGVGIAPAAGAAQAQMPHVPGLTRYVSEWIATARYDDIPAGVLELGRKSMLDGFGLALAGSRSEMGPLVRQYVQSLGTTGGKASVIGTAMKVAARFAAFANGIFIHADDY